METNSFYCPNCKKRTRHIEISYKEESAIEKESKIVQLWGTLVNDYAGAKKIIKLFGYTSYKCMECGRCAERKADGSEYRFIGFSK